MSISYRQTARRQCSSVETAAAAVISSARPF
jgi:hypothetical protein